MHQSCRLLRCRPRPLITIFMKFADVLDLTKNYHTSEIFLKGSIWLLHNHCHMFINIFIIVVIGIFVDFHYYWDTFLLDAVACLLTLLRFIWCCHIPLSTFCISYISVSTDVYLLSPFSIHYMSVNSYLLLLHSMQMDLQLRFSASLNHYCFVI